MNPDIDPQKMAIVAVGSVHGALYASIETLEMI
jgi:hypothetical protein